MPRHQYLPLLIIKGYLQSSLIFEALIGVGAQSLPRYLLRRRGWRASTACGGPVSGLFVLRFGCSVSFSCGSLMSESIWIATGLVWYEGDRGEEGSGGVALWGRGFNTMCWRIMYGIISFLFLPFERVAGLFQPS